MNVLFSIYDIFFILVWHFFADFMLQTNWQAMNKSRRNSALFNHVLTYSFSWLLPFGFVFGFWKALLFTIITFIFHFITDYITSRVNTILANEVKKTGVWHDFFVSVGFDQILHYIQLFLTYYLISM